MNKVKIVLDPGHGDLDRYNVGPTGYVEADGNLKTALFLREYLLKTYENIEIQLTRESDETKSLTSRGLMGKGVDLFHSIHSNATDDPAVIGTEVFYSVDIPQDELFAKRMSQNIAWFFDTKNRGAKTKESTKFPGEDFMTVIDVAQDNGAKHVLLSETLFHSNPVEELLLKDDKNLKCVAEIMGDTYAKFLPLVRRTVEPAKENEDIDGLKKNPNLSVWAVDGYNFVTQNGISDGTDPEKPVTREQVWVMLKQFNDYLSKKDRNQ